MMDSIFVIAEGARAVVLVLLSAALVTVALWLIKRLGFIRDENLRNAIIEAVMMGKDIIYSAVDMVSQTYVNDLKAASADGKLAPDEKAEAKRRAVQAFYDSVSPQTQELISKAVGDLSAWVSTQIEAYIARRKAESGVKQVVAGLASPK